jgi:hypothetical protein
VAVNRPAERDLLLARLDGQRHHVLAQLEGLSDEHLRRPVLALRSTTHRSSRKRGGLPTRADPTGTVSEGPVCGLVACRPGHLSASAVARFSVWAPRQTWDA